MASDEHVRQLESDLRRERLARRIVDEALRQVTEHRDRLLLEIKELKKRLR